MDSNELIEDLCFHIRHIEPRQFKDKALAHQMLSRLAHDGVLGYEDVISVPVSAVELLYVHTSSNQSADWNLLAHELRNRWCAVQPEPVRLYFATAKTIQRFGGDMAGRLGAADALSHDCGTTATYISLIATDPTLRTAWVPEERIPEAYGVVHPDAMLADANGPRVLIEFCGQYSAERLQRLGEFANSQNLPLHLWTIAVQENP